MNNTWADRSLPTDAYWPLASRNQGNISGLAMPWEIYMQMCIQTGTPGTYFNNFIIINNNDFIIIFVFVFVFDDFG